MNFRLPPDAMLALQLPLRNYCAIAMNFRLHPDAMLALQPPSRNYCVIAMNFRLHPDAMLALQLPSRNYCAIAMNFLRCEVACVHDRLQSGEVACVHGQLQSPPDLELEVALCGGDYHHHCHCCFHFQHEHHLISSQACCYVYAGVAGSLHLEIRQVLRSMR